MFWSLLPFPSECRLRSMSSHVSLGTQTCFIHLKRSVTLHTVLKSPVCTLEKSPLLRFHAASLCRKNGEERCVKDGNVLFDKMSTADIDLGLAICVSNIRSIHGKAQEIDWSYRARLLRVWVVICLQVEAVFGHLCHSRASLYQHIPECPRTRNILRELQREANNRDGFQTFIRC